MLVLVLTIWQTGCPACRSRKYLGCLLMPLAARSARSSLKLRKAVMCRLSKTGGHFPMVGSSS